MNKVITFWISFLGDQLFWTSSKGEITPARVYIPNVLESVNPDERESLLYKLLSPGSGEPRINHRTLFDSIANTSNRNPPPGKITLQSIRTSDGNIFVDYEVTEIMYFWLLNNYSYWSSFNIGTCNWLIHGYRFYIVL
jgi:hypothetical protein